MHTRIRIEVHGFLTRVVPQELASGPVSLEFQSPPTVYHLLATVLGIQGLQATVLVNGSFAGAGYTLRDGDEVQVLSPIPGG